MDEKNTSEPLDVQLVLATSPVAHVEYYQSLGSTHDLAHELARDEHSPLPLLIVAESQTAGRGRGQNRWWTGGGSLAFSLVFEPANWEMDGQLLPQRSLAVGVAIVRAVEKFISQQRVGLHWPNDVFVDGRKIAGVLVDVLSGGRHVVGIGLNVNNSFALAPAEVAGRATSLRELAGQPLNRSEVLCEVLRQLKLAMQGSAADPMQFGAQFGSLCLQIGQELTIEVAGRRTQGCCAGIAPDGALLLETAGGEQRFYTGALVHEPPVRP